MPETAGHIELGSGYDPELGGPPKDDPGQARLDSDYQRLRELLFQAEATGLEEARVEIARLRNSLKEAVGDIESLKRDLADANLRASNVADILPESIHLRNGQDEAFSRAIEPSVTVSIASASHKDPDKLAEAIYPSMLPAISRSVAAAMARLTDRLNHTLKYGLSVTGLRWRLEAARLGVPFPEYVISKTLRFRVEHLFLIHGQTGLLLNHVAADAQEELEGDIVSGMLTAIQDFAREGLGGGSDSVDTIQLGDLVVWIERSLSGNVVLAAVIRGIASPQLRDQMNESVQKIANGFASNITSFEGDDQPFELTTPILEECLVESFIGDDPEDKPDPSNGKKRILRGVLVISAVALLVWSGFRIYHGLVWSGYVSEVQAQSGISISHEEYREIRGVRSADSLDPESLLSRHGISREDVEMKWLVVDALP